MTSKLDAHMRQINLGESMSHADMTNVCNGLQAKYKNIIYFAPPRYHAVWPRPGEPGKFHTGYREPLHLQALFHDPESCFLLLRDEQLQYDRAPGVHMSLRAPWPEEEIGHDPMLRRGRLHGATEYTVYDDSEFWRKKGRLLDVLFPPVDIQTENAFESRDTRWLQEPKNGGFTHVHFGDARLLAPTMFGILRSRYNVSDPECAAFMRDARSIFGKQKTTRIGFYAPATGEYLGPNKGPYKSSCGRELLRWLCFNPTVFLHFNVLNPFARENKGPLAAKGPSPDFKAEVFLEEGLPIDDIAGLTDADKDRLKRRFEKKQKLAAKAAATPKT